MISPEQLQDVDVRHYAAFPVIIISRHVPTTDCIGTVAVNRLVIPQKRRRRLRVGDAAICPTNIALRALVPIRMAMYALHGVAKKNSAGLASCRVVPCYAPTE